MVLMSCTLGFNIFTIFSFYTKMNAQNAYTDLQTDMLSSLPWCAIYTTPPLTVIFVGAVLRRKVKFEEFKVFQKNSCL